MSDHDDRCRHCGAAQPMCVYWKMHGYVACCPECQHRDEPDAIKESTCLTTQNPT
jgi:hypothetical protein